MAKASISDGLEWAVVRLVTYVPPGYEVGRLMFATVSLLGRDRLKPDTIPGVDHIKVSESGGKVFFRRIALRTTDALAWYTTPSGTLWKTPIPSENSERDPRFDGIPLEVSDLLDNPVWPQLGTATELFGAHYLEGDPVPFAGSANSTGQVHQRFGDDGGFERVLSDSATLEFIARRMHVDFRDYPEYLGSLCLTLPNPILLRVEEYLGYSEDPTQELLIVRLIPLPGKNLESITVTIFERRGNLLSKFITLPAPENGIIEFKEDGPIQATGYFISHAELGLLVYQQALSFVREVHTSLELTRRSLIIQAPLTESPTSALTNYRVPIYENQIHSSVRTQYNLPPDLGRVFEAEAKRRRRRESIRLRQTWFGGGQDERLRAMEFLQTEIMRARYQVLIADPYLSGKQNIQFLQAISRATVDLTILTARVAFDRNEVLASRDQESMVTNGEASQNRSITRMERLREFSDSLQALRDMRSMKVHAYILLGKEPVLHDRFLVIDDVIWFLGNSLNALGSRASLILQLPDPVPIFNELQAILSSAVPFADFLLEQEQFVSRGR